MNSKKLEDLVSKMGLSSDELELRKDYFGIYNVNKDALNHLQADINSLPISFITGFYNRLRAYPEIGDLLTDDVVDKLVISQSIYFSQLISGNYDEDYVRNRLRLGQIHYNVGIQPKWFMGAYVDYLNGILDIAFNDSETHEQEDLETVKALFRVVVFDISLGLESYFLADKDSITRLKEFNDQIIRSIPVGMVIIDEELVIQRANDAFLQLFELDEIKANSPLSRFIPVSQIKEIINKPADEIAENLSIRINVSINGYIRYLKLDITPQYIEDRFVVIITFHDYTEAERLTNELQDSQLRLSQILDNVVDVIITIDQKGKIVSANQSITEEFGYESDAINGLPIAQLIPKINSVEEVQNYYIQNKDDVNLIRAEAIDGLEGLTAKGNSFPVEVTITEILTELGFKLLLTVKNITEISHSRKKAYELSRVIEQTADSVLVTDENSIIQYVNPAFESNTGYSYDEVIGKRPSILKSGRLDQDFYQRLWETIKRGDVFVDVFINRKKNGETYYEEKTITPLKDEQGKIIRFVSTGKDVSERIHAEENLFHLANHDVLTDLPNRSLLSERIKQAISRARWNDRLVALLFLDLDQFKRINDSLGHDIGDDLIVEVAKRLKSCLRDGDTVSRLGGDEFAILLTDIASKEDIDPIAGKILDTVSEPYNIQNRELFVSVSIGISCFPEDGNTARTLLTNADVAMYRAKDNGRNIYEYFSVEMTTRAVKRLQMETGLRHALDNNEYILVYQPQIDRLSGNIIGVEALLRWNSPELGMVSPVEFVPILEDTGMIVSVGRWVIKRACLMMENNSKLNIHIPTVSINFSARQLTDESIVDFIKDCLNDAELAADRMTIEITESLLMENKQRSTSLLRKLSDIGVNIALDDFGTGYSSLSYLIKFPINIVKIDKSFVDGVPEIEQKASLASAIISMTHDLGLKVVAEGVENIKQVDFLSVRNCDVYQGFYFSKPINEKELNLMLIKEQEMTSN